ncbi:Tryptophan synthase subunit beta [Pelagerythrobacter marensis]|uniref:Tryptophan synthase subunit beta n=1 Tax=Pelagerythrobacter marensis TaxID=543877 RepID=A0A0G3X5D9_9SPHN|nr:Tryptophan synthase subunit beta [Pelagerythrobacter marensis]
MTALGYFGQLVPDEFMGVSGSVYYSGEIAFSETKPVYLLGLNPGGSPVKQAAETVGRQLETCSQPARRLWSAYADEEWLGKAAGTHGMQPRVLHLCDKLGLDPRRTPASNLIFVRSARGADLGSSRRDLIDRCWPFHDAVIRTLNIKMVVCFGRLVGQEVRNRLGAHWELATFTEENRRRWRSTIHASERGTYVASLTHPSVAAWNVPATDPTPMVASYLKQFTETAVR